MLLSGAEKSIEDKGNPNIGFSLTHLIESQDPNIKIKEGDSKINMNKEIKTTRTDSIEEDHLKNKVVSDSGTQKII